LDRSATRAQDIATDDARTREAFGRTLGETGGVSFMLPDNLMSVTSRRRGPAAVKGLLKAVSG
jgi:hypothetical protein